MFRPGAFLQIVRSRFTENRLAEFAAKWDDKFPMISKSWQANWARVIPFFAHPPEIRKVIYTTNAIESLNMSL